MPSSRAVTTPVGQLTGCRAGAWGRGAVGGCARGVDGGAGLEAVGAGASSRWVGCVGAGESLGVSETVVSVVADTTTDCVVAPPDGIECCVVIVANAQEPGMTASRPATTPIISTVRRRLAPDPSPIVQMILHGVPSAPTLGNIPVASRLGLR